MSRHEDGPVEHRMAGSPAPTPVHDGAQAMEWAQLSEARTAAVDALLVALADDAMLLGHRDSEWTGQGPILEEDIAFSSMAQDEMGHARVWYELRTAHLGAPSPDEQAFLRDAPDWRNARLYELPRGDYAFSLMRRYLSDVAKAIHYEALTGSALAELAVAARKLRQEKKYHLIHNWAFVERLGRATKDSRQRLQTALEASFAHALGIWEPTAGATGLEGTGIAPELGVLSARWLESVVPALRSAGLEPPVSGDGAGWTLTVEPEHGGRSGQHGDELTELLAAMQGMYRSDPEATW